MLLSNYIHTDIGSNVADSATLHYSGIEIMVMVKRLKKIYENYTAIVYKQSTIYQ